MPVIDESIQNAMLDAMMSVADTWEIALFTADPSLVEDPASVEVPALTDVDDGFGNLTPEANGYARVTTTTATDWATPAEGGAKSAQVPFADPVAPWPEATFWGAYDPVRGAWGPTAALLEPVVVTGAGSFPGDLRAVLFFDQPTEEF